MSHARIEALEPRRLFAAGDLDSTFEGDGKVILATAPTTPNAIAVQSDGKVLIAGGNQGSGYVMRLNSNGTIDGAFGVDGDNDGIRFTDNTADIALLSSGKFLLVGNGYIQRYNSNGSIDGTFTSTFFNHTAIIYKIAVRSDGKILVATQNQSQQEIFVYRINANGGLDSTLDGDGEFTVPLIGMETLREILVQSDNKPIVVGNERPGTQTTQSNFMAARFQTNSGILDQPYGNAGNPSYGVARADFGGFDRVNGATLQSDGKLVMVGTGFNGGFGVARLLTNGQYDTGFSGDGKVLSTSIDGQNGSAIDVVQSSDGKLVVLGRTNNNQYGLARYTTGGVLDSTFGGNGTILVNFISTPQFAVPVDLSLSPSNKVVFAGYQGASNGALVGNVGRVLLDSASQPGSISGLVYADEDADGVKDAADDILTGRKFFIDADKDGVFDAGEVNVLTNSNGIYTFSNLAPGNYRIRRADMPSSAYFSTPSAGYHDVTITSGLNVTGKNFGVVNYSKLTGNVFRDVNGDGVQNSLSTEPNMSAWRVYIDADGDNTYDVGELTALTNSSGLFTINVKVGSYVLRVVQQAGFALTKPLPSGEYTGTIGVNQTIGARQFGQKPI